jgi:PAS domain S-box-containing protein
VGLSANKPGNERDRAETALRQTEELYRRAIAGAGAVPYASDFKTRSYLFMGEGIEQLIGYAADEVTGELWPRIIQESVMLGDAAGLTKHEAAQRVFAGQLRNWRCDMRVLTRSGQSRWISDASVQNFDDAGQPIGAVGILQDITERKRAEDERNRLFNLSADMLCVAGFDGRLKQVNPAWTLCLGWTAEELTSRPMSDFILPEDDEATRRTREQIHQGKTVRGFENRYRCKDGSYRWLSWSVHPWIVSRQVFAVARDVTQQKQAEEKLAQQAALLNEAREAIFVIDLEDRITFWNHGAERICGWKSAEALGKKYRELFSLQKAPVEEATRLLFENGHWQGELKKKTQSGRDLIMETRWTLVRDEQGQPKCILAINTDITEKKKLEAQFLRTQRMESIGTLAGGIAHDLNNVLAPILMSVEILKMSFTDEDSHKLLQTVQASADRGSDLVKQVLSFARGVEGQRVIVNPLHLMRELLKVMRDTFPKTISVRFTPAPDLWTINGDATQLHQVFLNLCVNARDAMPHGGNLTVTMENVVLDDTYAAMNPDSTPGAYVNVKVSDSGSGIPTAIQDKIFEPFFTTKEFGKGTGLGLSTTLAIVKSHGGFINLYSEIGKGATFQVYLPANTTEVAADKSAVEQIGLPRGNGEMVLVVDDEESIRHIAQRTLERFGYKVMLACHGAEAVSLYAQNRNQIAVVLTDMAMPIMDGPALIIALKAINPKVRIVGSSGLATRGGVTRAVGTGIEHFVPKPYTAEAMLTVLKKILDENSPA